MKVLLIRLSSAGDILAAFRAVRALKKAGHTVHIAVKDAYTGIAKILGCDEIYGLKKGGLNELVTRLKKNSYGAVVDIQGNLKSRFISASLKAPVKRLYRKDSAARRIMVIFKLYFGSRIPVYARYLAALAGIVPDKIIADESAPKKIKNPAKFRVLVHTGARWPLKRWPYYHELVKLLAAEKNVSAVVITGVKDEVAKNDGILYIKGRKIRNLIGKTTLAQMAGEAGKADLFIGNDTVAAHAAAIHGIPSFVMLGPTVSEFGFITKPVFSVIQRNLACRPCSLHGGNRCITGTFECMKKISAEDVIETVLPAIRGKKRR